MFKRMTFVYWSHPEARGSRRAQISAVMAGLMWSIMVTLFCGVILALWVTLSEQPRYHLSGILGLCMFAGAVIGGGISGLHARKQGWLNGGVVGLAYGIVCLAMIAGGGVDGMFNPLVLGRLPVLTLAGALGGIVGVNLPQNRARTVRRPCR